MMGMPITLVATTLYIYMVHEGQLTAQISREDVLMIQHFSYHNHGSSSDSITSTDSGQESRRDHLKHISHQGFRWSNNFAKKKGQRKNSFN